MALPEGEQDSHMPDTATGYAEYLGVMRLVIYAAFVRSKQRIRGPKGLNNTSTPLETAAASREGKIVIDVKGN